jgi:hypothetical protein
LTVGFTITGPKRLRFDPVVNPVIGTAMMQMFKAGVIYFLLVFAVEWILGLIRGLWAVPHFGRMATMLSEAFIMLVAMIVAARWVIRPRFSNAPCDDLDGYSCDRIAAPG